MFTVLVCGGRDYDDYHKLESVLLSLCDKKKLWQLSSKSLRNSLRVVTGACPTGADHLAKAWAGLWDARYQGYPADWKKFGLRAGPVRNQEMINSEKIDLMIAFPGGAGTRDCVWRARKAGIPVQEVK